MKNVSAKKICKRYKFILLGVLIILCIQLSLFSFSPITNSSESEPSSRVSINKPTDRNKTNGSDPPLQIHDSTDKKSFQFQPKCHITVKDSLSAISRAKTELCKQEIADVSCLSLEGKLFPKDIPNYCPFKGNHTSGFYYGCFGDKTEQRDLSHHKEFPDTNSPKNCIKYCTNGGYLYAGLQYMKECWCGDRFGSHGKVDTSLCNNQCPGDPSKPCGGYQANSIYTTGLGAKIKNPVELLGPITQTTQVKIVFVLTLNGRAVRQVRRLLKAIYHRDHFYYIHVDSRQQYLYDELLPLESMLPNVRLTRNRFATIWGGASLLQAHLAFIKELLEMTDWTWDYYINLSESDYPIKNLETLVNFLTRYNGKVFMKSHGRDTPKFLKKQGLDQIFHECDNHLWRLGPRELPNGLRFDGGSDWVGLHRKFCEYVITSDPLLDGLKEFYKYTLLPAESFFHTVLQNSIFCDKWMDNNLHVTNWIRKKGCKCQNKHIVDWCGCSPNDFKSTDLQRLMVFEQRPRFFARKFEPAVNQDIINSLDLYLFKDRPQDMKSYTKYWQNEFHFKDKTSNKTDTLLSFYGSFQRKSLESQKLSSCHLKPVRTLESNAYFVEDHYNGALVLYEAQHEQSGKIVTLESHFTRRRHYIVSDPQGPAGRLLSLEIGTEYDLKENIFRNFGQVIGPYSDLTLEHSWSSGSDFTVSVAWIDPTDVVAASYDIEIPGTNHIGSLKPDLKVPLRPGVWKVKLMHKWEVVAETSFLVVPLTTFQHRPVKFQQVLSFHNGPGSLYIDKDFKDFDTVLQVNRTVQLQKDADSNGRKTGGQLDQWVDNLTKAFWEYQNICISGESSIGCLELDICEKTLWSSRSEDPKSELHGIDSKSGRLR
ncbi:xylosyltransferase 1-like [Mytilus galloprovincialis]|uniref:xylosyltransferase 1-like n=1 Tax=Mytilus galloprovincialis TaxID=29158 RepID=UPI003F7C2BFF